MEQIIAQAAEAIILKKGDVVIKRRIKNKSLGWIKWCIKNFWVGYWRKKINKNCNNKIFRKIIKKIKK